MALADRGANCLTGLLSGTVLHCNVLIRPRPCLLLITSGLENTLVGEYQMTSLFDDFFYFSSQFYGLVCVFFVEFILLLRHIFSLHLLKLEPVEPQNLTIVLRPDDSVGKLPME